MDTAWLVAVFLALVLAGAIVLLVKMIRRTSGQMRSFAGVSDGLKENGSENNIVRGVQYKLSVASVLLGYTALKWGFVAVDYAINGVQPEANVFLFGLIFPVGIVLWLWGIIDQILVTMKINRKDFPKMRLKTSSKVIVVVNYVLIGLSVVELVMIYFSSVQA